MTPNIVILVYIVLLIWLLRVEYNNNPYASHLLWIPTLWFIIMASRPVGAWFSLTPDELISYAEGSPHDRVVLSILITIGIIGLLKSKINWSWMFRDNILLLLLYLYLLLSIIWSDYPFNSFKRWFKISGTLVMAFVICSENNPYKALESVVRRSAYVLVPLSLVLIKYFPVYGVKYHTWTGTRMGTGVTSHKNTLGVLCSVIAFVLIWSTLHKIKSKKILKLKTILIADIIIISSSIFMLFGGMGTYSATSIIIFCIGLITLLILFYVNKLTKYVARNLKMVIVTFAVLFFIFYSFLLPIVTSLLGRNENLTDRDVIWSGVIEVASDNPIFGVGYGAFWGLVKGTAVDGIYQSHNGYIEVFLQIGLFGILVLISFILELCGKVSKRYNYLSDWNTLVISFIMMLLLYNYAEASFISANLIWTLVVFIAVVLSIKINKRSQLRTIQGQIIK